MGYPGPRELEIQLLRAWPPEQWSDVTLLVAVSGGGDSVALLRLLEAVRQPGPGRLVVAHYNHRRRPSADTDANFVRTLCRQRGLELALGAAAPLPAAKLPGVPDSRGLGDQPASGQPDTSLAGDEASLRAQRYAFFRESVDRWGARYLVTAHTRDDQAETVLHRVIRGTGLAGLAGIPRVRQFSSGCGLIRPLLDIRRQELRGYLEHLGQPFREDPTNHDRAYTRNRLRQELLPHLAEHYNRRIDEALARLAGLAGECGAVVERRVAELVEQAGHEAPGEVRLNRGHLAGESRYVVRELLVALWTRQGWPRQEMGFAEWNALADLALPDLALPDLAPAPVPTRRHFPGGILAERDGGTLWLRESGGPGAVGRPA